MYTLFFSPGFVSALGSPRPVAGAAERLRHALLRAREDVAAGAHGAPHDHRLPRELVVDGDEGVVGGERAGGALAVNQQGLEIAVHDVLLHLRARRVPKANVCVNVEKTREKKLPFYL